jgi:hypothetical protein
MKAIISKGSEDVAPSVVGIGETEDAARADTANATYGRRPMRGGECVEVSDRYAEAVLFVRAQDQAWEAAHLAGDEFSWHPDCALKRWALGYVVVHNGVADFADDAFERAEQRLAGIDQD